MGLSCERMDEPIVGGKWRSRLIDGGYGASL